MSLLEQQVIELRRQMQLLKNSQVSITDTQPKEPSKQSIWREGSTLKTWDGKNWTTIAGSSIDFSFDIELTAVDYNTVSWSSGTINVAYPNGVATYAIGAGSTDLTATTYFYWQSDIPTAVQTTLVPENAIMNGGILLATGFPNIDITGKVVLNIFGGKGVSPFITTADIANNAVSTAKIALLAITDGLIAANAVTETKILNDSITSPKILAGAIIAGKIAANAVTANEIAAGSVTASKIFANTITAAQIAAGTITANEIATATITAGKLVANTITANELSTALIYAGSITLSSGGVIRSGKTTYADALTGFWLGSDSGTPKFKIGTSTTYMDWNGSAFSIVGGTITGGIIQTATSGKRIILESNTLKSYDSSGVIRVQSAEEGLRITDYLGSVNADISAREFSGPGGIPWPYLLIGDTSSPYNRVGLRTSFLAGHPTATDKSLRLYLDGGSMTFRSIGGGGTSGTGVTLTSPDDDTLTFDGKKINFNGTILEKIGTDLYWNGVKIN